MRIISLLAVTAMALAGPAAIVSAQTAPVAAKPAPAAAAPASPMLQEGYVIGIGDVLDVALIGSEDFRGRVTVQQDGTIQLPYVGTLKAQEKTLLALSKEIAAALTKGGYYVNPAIQVTLASIQARYVTVLGAVPSPGLITLDRAYRASELIARAGGIAPTGAETFYLRQANGTEIPLTLEGIARGGPDADPVVNPGDKVFVPLAPTFYIYGQVNGPGTFPITSKMTLRMALARGGGLTQLGSDKRITVVRNGVELKKFSLSDAVQKDDVIVVGERLF